MKTVKNFVVGAIKLLLKAAQDRADARAKQIIRGS